MALLFQDAQRESSILRSQPHTIVEARFGVMEPNISAWRRKTVGDLTTALGFSTPASPDSAAASLPGTSSDLPAGCPTLTNPVPFVAKPEPIAVPARQSMPAQEPGQARRRA